MAISRARRNFRRFLLVILGGSFVFAATASYYFVSTKNDYKKLTALAPTLFHIDVAHHKAKAFFEDDDGKFIQAGLLARKGFFSSIYRDAGSKMLISLVEKGHVPSQIRYADTLTSKNNPSLRERYKAMALYENAARQDNLYAREKLKQIQKELLAAPGLDI